MSGKIEFMVRSGKSKDRNFDRYPEWYWKITGEDKTIINISPGYPELNYLLKQAFIHEFLNDWMRERRTSDFTVKRIQFNLPVLLEYSQTTFEEHWKDPYRIPDIYHKCNYEKW